MTQHHIPSVQLHYSNSCKQFSAYIFPTPTHALTSMILGWLTMLLSPSFTIPTCTTLSLTCARNHANRVSGVDSTNLQGSHPGVLNDPTTECVIQNANRGYVLYSLIEYTGSNRCSSQLPYSGKLSREKTCTNFKVCGYSRKFSL